ncbi:hypothetical protein KUTeg_023870 [Tegillarca granosa]|uniref:C2H2-type domain-containing protein n=1 Tax=Tegillarca granosa TaxID=220873 RepID=A0ABQ9E3U2_TEGGR|nr:hypothetical protein KUTeg_023870 [Tegillarca granosa]
MQFKKQRGLHIEFQNIEQQLQTIKDESRSPLLIRQRYESTYDISNDSSRGGDNRKNNFDISEVMEGLLRDRGEAPKGVSLVTIVICDKTFENKKSLIRHKRAKHSGVTYPCSTCGKTFEYVGHITHHERACNPGPKQFDCNICGKRYATEGGLRRHQEVHLTHQNQQ